MCKLILRYSTNNIFLTFLVKNKKIYSKSTGQFAEYKKGKRKISNLALIFLLNNFINFYFLNFKKKKFLLFFFEIFGCTLKRFFFLKKNLINIVENFNYIYFFFLNKNLFSFNGCKLKKEKRKRRRRKKLRIN